jgi:branched-chain amino acid transport system ATP-binding protein
MSEPLLAVRGVTAFYGRVMALKGVDLDVHDGEIVTLIGANGAGKSTLMMTICGNPRAREGSIVFDGRNISKLPTHEIARLKIAQAPEGRRIFVRMTVLENLQMGAALGEPGHFDADLARIFSLFPRLRERLDQRGGTLSGGEQQMLAIARAMMLEPKIILLDEPTEGLMPRMVSQIHTIIDTLHAEGTAILLVEQNVPLTLAASQRIYIMEKGSVRHHCASRDIDANHPIVKQYMGV